MRKFLFHFSSYVLFSFSIYFFYSIVVSDRDLTFKVLDMLAVLVFAYPNVYLWWKYKKLV